MACANYSALRENDFPFAPSDYFAARLRGSSLKVEGRAPGSA